MTIEEIKLDGCNIGKFLDLISEIVHNQKQVKGWHDYCCLGYASDELNSLLDFCRERQKEFSPDDLEKLNAFKEKLFRDFPDNSRASRDIKHAIEIMINQLVPKKEER